MIELKNITKIYKSKKQSVEALKGINLKLEEKGLTFIIGKSGSGKSSLLNILGGLDSYTDGELIINNKSSKTFKERDWDAYRNTYIGFVFQDYNLLDNYTVEDNIKLALELQHKKTNEEDIDKILKLVELENVSKRKPTELSGGQKQRVAIARALIKNPEIIIADEPTGNLDSATSEQIFNVLKKLSEDKLVIVVSHDEEAASKYANRIIKIADGLIINDTLDRKIDEMKEFNLVNAKLPIIYSFKMGLGNLLHKKIRLILTMILIVLCLTCFGVMTSTLNTNINKDYLDLFEEKGETEVYIKKYNKMVENGNVPYISSDGDMYELPVEEEMTYDILNEVEDKTKMNWYGMYDLYNDYQRVYWMFNYEKHSNDHTLYNYVGFAQMGSKINLILADDEMYKNLNLIGKQPATKDEVVISSYVADMIIKYGINSSATANASNIKDYKPTTYEQIINDNIYINFGYYKYVKVCGIIDYTKYLSKYDELKKVKETTYQDMDFTSDEYRKVDSLYSELQNDTFFLNRVYVTEDFIKNLELNKLSFSNELTLMMYKDETYNIDLFEIFNSNLLKVYDKNGEIKNIELKDNEIIINTSMLNVLTNYDYENKLNDYVFYGSENYDTSVFLKNYLKTNNIIDTEIKTNVKDNRIYKNEENYATYKIVGVVSDNTFSNIVYYNSNNIDELVTDSIEFVSLFRNVKTKDELNTIINYYPIDKSDIISSSKYSEVILNNIFVAKYFKIVGKYGTIFFLVLSSLLLMNYILNSIKFRTKEIGILRAIGCRSIDVIKIFLYECLVLTIFSVISSSLIVPIITNKLNELLNSNFYIRYDIFQFGVLQILSITSIMLLIVVVASILPIRRITKLRPIDAILDKS